MSGTTSLVLFLAAAAAVALAAASAEAGSGDVWVVDSEAEWGKARSESRHLSLADGLAAPTEDTARFTSVVRRYDTKRKAARIVFEQSASWDNWEPIPNVGPKGTRNAPVFLPVGDGDYWYFAERRGGGSRGYHAWHSSDMEAWTHHGRVTESRWMTTAEHADGTFYLYYDEPNDEDPHLVISEDLTGGETRNVGKVFADPSHGSDAGILRDADGSFHLIYEDWSPINARQHSWDSPLAGHAESPDGIKGFEPHEHPAPIDERTVPLPEFGTYQHPFSGEHTYHKHQGPQDAFGDFTLIRVGGRYYIFCDYDPHGEPMRVGYWSSDALDQRFEWGGDVGEGFHPDPTIGFAEGKFYLIVQRNNQDFVSPGPWGDGVEARAGVDTDGDGKVDEWTEWQVVREGYSKKPGFARIVDVEPAAIDLSGLPAGSGFRFEFRIGHAVEGEAKPLLDRVSLSFE